MKVLNPYKTYFFIYGLPLLIVVFSIIIALSPILEKYPEIAIGLTYDLTILAPLVFLFLSRRSTVSKLRVIPFFVGGILIASQLIPENQQEHLNYIKTYLFPVIEISVFGIIILKLRKYIKLFKSNAIETNDFYEISKKSTEEFLGKSKFSAFVCTEITMMYYAFFAWHKSETSSKRFTNYKENAGIALAGALLMVVFVETYAFHILLAKWNETVAWIFTGLSIYTALMIVAHVKALILSPSILTKDKLILKNGLIARATIDLNSIDKVQYCTKELHSTEEIKIGNLGINKKSTNHNISIHFKKEQLIEKAYGLGEKCNVLLFHIDNKNEFFNQLNKALEQKKSLL